MHRKRWIPLLIIVAVAVVVLGTLFARRGRGETIAYRTEAAQRGDLRVVVSATGTLNPVTTVLVGSQVSGTIAALNADFNSRVEKGQILAQLDPTFLRAQVAQSEADLERAQVEQRQAERDLARLEPLQAEGLTSQAEIDAAQTALESARASVKGAAAALDRAQTNLRYATIKSPIDGVVISRDVDVGQTVAASLSAPTLFTIANDLTRMQLEASVDEADIGQITVGQEASFTVDAFPERQFTGIVEQIRLAPRTEQNVVSYTVIIRVENPESQLLPGMTANVTFVIEEATDVLKVPAVALRFRPHSAGAPWGAVGANGRALGGVPGGERPGNERTGGQDATAGRPGGQDATAGNPDSERRGAPGSAIYVLHGNNQLRRVGVRVGISDGVLTAVYSDSLKEGDPVVISAAQQLGDESQGPVNPFMPGGGRRDRH